MTKRNHNPSTPSRTKLKHAELEVPPVEDLDRSLRETFKAQITQIQQQIDKNCGVFATIYSNAQAHRSWLATGSASAWLDPEWEKLTSRVDSGFFTLNNLYSNFDSHRRTLVPQVLDFESATHFCKVQEFCDLVQPLHTHMDSLLMDLEDLLTLNEQGQALLAQSAGIQPQ